jgi:hypothetical protein
MNRIAPVALPAKTSTISGADANDISDSTEGLFEDTRLLRKLSDSDIDAVEVCKSYAFDPSQLNWHIADTDSWLRKYSLENKHRHYFQLHGVISTIALDFLGITNFKCALGSAHLCRVDCPSVVKSVEDLEVARNVFFTLASTGNLLTAMEIVHVSCHAKSYRLRLIACL